jgi:hypothetical protein
LKQLYKKAAMQNKNKNSELKQKYNWFILNGKCCIKKTFFKQNCVEITIIFHSIKKTLRVTLFI